jgi:Ser/Thr protein kinase RdoA (MazF antagonist)
MSKFFPVVHSTLSAQALLTQVLPLYDIESPEDCKLLNIGLNDTYVLTCNEGKLYILRVYRAGWRTLENILYEIDVLLHLNKKGVTVSIPLPGKNGIYVNSLEAPEGPRNVVLFTYAQGKEPDYEEEIQATQYGRAVAKVHAATDDFVSAHSRFSLDIDHLIESPLKAIKPLLKNRIQDWEYLNALSDVLCRQLNALPIANLGRGFCHGDLHGWNANFTDDGTVTLYDFDCCGFGWRAYDVAVFRWCARLREKEQQRWPAYLKGYQESRNLNQTELTAIPLFIGIRHFWLMGVHTSNAKEFGYGWVNDSYFDRELGFLRQWEKDCLDKEGTG